MRKPLALLMLASALTGLPAHPSVAATPDPLSGYRQVPGIGLARDLPGGGFELFRDRGTGRMVHGNDTTSMIPATLDDASTASFSNVEPTCVTSGNYYAHVIYAYPIDRASRYASMAEHIRDLVRDNTGRLVEEAGEFGASRKYRVLCNASNQITVSNVGVSVTSVTDFNALTLDLENRGYNAPGVKYWVWFEGTTGPGILGTGHVYDDSSPAASNSNNGNGNAMFAVLWGDEAGVPQYEATTWMHENGHNMGAVVSDAPNTSGNLHCTDDQDIMCYVDGGAQAACCFRSNVCTDREHFDCRHDDYFHPSPTSGFLTNHWNLGSTVNRFLDATSAITPTLTLTDPTGASLGRASHALTIAASDQQPDVIVQGTAPTATGNNQYSTTPGAQSALVASPRATGPTAATAFIENDGNATNTFTLYASVPNAPTELRYLIGGIDVTTAITSASGYPITLDALTRLAVRVEHQPVLTALPGSQRGVVVRAAWTGDGVRQDTATLTFVTV